jgi:hypothetical protein
VSFDEVGPAALGVQPDADDKSHDAIRQWGLWGHLMAGGAGVEWYFGSTEVGVLGREKQRIWWDLEAEDWRTREEMWRQTRVALEFFHRHLPFTRMQPQDRLASGDAWVLAEPGEVYAVYLRPPWSTRSTTLDLGPWPREYEVRWYDTLAGGEPRPGAVTRIVGPGPQPLGAPPADPERDWVVLVRRLEAAPSTDGKGVARP